MRRDSLGNAKREPVTKANASTPLPADTTTLTRTGPSPATQTSYAQTSPYSVAAARITGKVSPAASRSRSPRSPVIGAGRRPAGAGAPAGNSETAILAGSRSPLPPPPYANPQNSLLLTSRTHAHANTTSDGTRAATSTRRRKASPAATGTAAASTAAAAGKQTCKEAGAHTCTDTGAAGGTAGGSPGTTPIRTAGLLRRAVSSQRRQLPRARTASTPTSSKGSDSRKTSGHGGGEDSCDLQIRRLVRRATSEGGTAGAAAHSSSGAHRANIGAGSAGTTSTCDARSVVLIPTRMQQLQAPSKRLAPQHSSTLHHHRDTRPESLSASSFHNGGTGGAGNSGLHQVRAPAALVTGPPFRAMTPIVHVRVRPLLPEMGESNDHRKVWFLDHENLVVRGPCGPMGTAGTGGVNSCSAAATGGGGGGMRATDRRGTLAPSRVRDGGGCGAPTSPLPPANAQNHPLEAGAAPTALLLPNPSPMSPSLSSSAVLPSSNGARLLHDEGINTTGGPTCTHAYARNSAAELHSRTVSEQSAVSEQAAGSGRTSPGRLSSSSPPPLPLMQPSSSPPVSGLNTPRPQPMLTAFLTRPATPVGAGAGPGTRSRPATATTPVPATDGLSPQSSPGAEGLACTIASGHMLTSRSMTGSPRSPLGHHRRTNSSAAALGMGMGGTGCGGSKGGARSRKDTRTRDGRGVTNSSASNVFGSTGGGVEVGCADSGAGHEQHFSFEFIHDERATQQEVFEDSVLRFADEALLAQNITILCYGPTGSGKTFSMMGNTPNASGGAGGGGFPSRRQSVVTGATVAPGVSVGGPGSFLCIPTSAANTGNHNSGSSHSVVGGRQPQPAPFPSELPSAIATAVAEEGMVSPPSGGRLAHASASDWLEDSIAQVSAEDTDDDEWPMFDHTWYRDRQRRAMLMDAANGASVYGRGSGGVAGSGGDHLRSTEMGILPRLVRVLLDRRNETVTLTSVESATPPATPALSGTTTANATIATTGGSGNATVPGASSMNAGDSRTTRCSKHGAACQRGASASARGKRKQATHGPSRRTVTLTLREITFYGVEIYCDELTDLMDPGKRPVTNVSDTGGLAALCTRLDQARDDAVRAAMGGAFCGGSTSNSHASSSAANTAANNNSSGTTTTAGAATAATRQTGSGLSRVGTGGGIPMESLEDLKRAYRLARRNRVTGTHAKNDTSSRSHAAFFLQLHFELVERIVSTTTTEVLDEIVQPVDSYVAMVDLAGSERLKETQVESGRGLREAQYINKSLSALSSVVLALYRRSSHIPYRDSKLTRLLRPCLEGGRVLILVHVAPCSGANTLNTLKFADQVRHTLVQTHSFSGNANKRGLINIFEDLIDPEQAKLEVAMTHAQETYDQLCAEIRLAHLSGAVLPDAPVSFVNGSAMGRDHPSVSYSAIMDNSVTLTMSNTSSARESLRVDERGEDPDSLANPNTNAADGNAARGPSLLKLPADATPAAQRGYRVRTLCERHLVPLRESEDAGVQAAMRDIALERDRRVEAARRRLESEALALQDAIAEMTRFNTQLALENANPLPTDPYCQELAKQARAGQEELRELQGHTAALQSGVHVLRQRVATQEDIQAGVDADLEEMRGKGLLPAAAATAANSTVAAAAGVHPFSSVASPLTTSANDTSSGSPGPKASTTTATPGHPLPTSPPPNSALNYVDSEVATDTEMREIGFQQVMLAQELSALRMEIACFVMGDGIWEGLWARAMRQELLTALRVEVALVEKVLLDPAVLSSLVDASKELAFIEEESRGNGGTCGNSNHNGGCGRGSTGGGGGSGSGRGGQPTVSAERSAGSRGDFTNSTPPSPLAGAGRHRVSIGGGSRRSPGVTPRQNSSASGGGGVYGPDSGSLKAPNTPINAANPSKVEFQARTVAEARAAVEAYLAQCQRTSPSRGGDKGIRRGYLGGNEGDGDAPSARGRDYGSGGLAEREGRLREAGDALTPGGETPTRLPEEGTPVWNATPPAAKPRWLPNVGAVATPIASSFAGNTTTNTTAAIGGAATAVGSSAAGAAPPPVVGVPNPLEAVWYRGLTSAGCPSIGNDSSGAPSPPPRRPTTAAEATSTVTVNNPVPATVAATSHPDSRRASLAEAITAAFTPTSLVGCYDSEEEVQRASVRRMLTDGVPCEVVCVGGDFEAALATVFMGGGGKDTATAAGVRSGGAGEGGTEANDTGGRLATYGGADTSKGSNASRPTSTAPVTKHMGRLRLTRRPAKLVAGGGRGLTVRHLPTSTAVTNTCTLANGGAGAGMSGGYAGAADHPEAGPFLYCLEFVYTQHGIPLPPRVVDAISTAISPAPRTQLEELVDSLPSSMDVHRTHAPVTGTTSALSSSAAALMKERRLFSIPLSEPQLTMNLHLLESGTTTTPTTSSSSVSVATTAAPAGSSEDTSSSVAAGSPTPAPLAVATADAPRPAARRNIREECGPQIALELRGLPFSNHSALAQQSFMSATTTNADDMVSSPGQAPVGKDVVLAKRLREGGELLIPALCIVANKGVCTLVFRFPVGLMAPSTQLESVEMIVAALCGVMPPAWDANSPVPSPMSTPLAAARTAAGNPRQTPRDHYHNSGTNTDACQGASMPLPLDGSAEDAVRDGLVSGRDDLVRGYAHIPYVLLRPNLINGATATAAASGSARAGHEGNVAEATGAKGVGARGASPDPQRPAGLRRAGNAGRGASSRSSRSTPSKSNGSSGWRSDSLPCLEPAVPVRGAGLRVRLHFPGSASDNSVDLVQLIREGTGAPSSAAGRSSTLALQILRAATLLQGLRTITLGPLAEPSDTNITTAISATSESRDNLSLLRDTASTNLSTGWRVAQGLQQHHIFTRHIRSLVRQQIFEAEDIRAEFLNIAAASSGGDVGMRADGCCNRVGVGGIGAYWPLGRHLKDVVLEAREAVGSFTSGLAAGGTGGSPQTTPGRDSRPMYPHQDPKASGDDGPRSGSFFSRALAPVRGVVAVSLARELGSTVLPWTLWQWAYRWPAVTSLCQQLERAALAAAADPALSSTPLRATGGGDGSAASLSDTGASPLLTGPTAAAAMAALLHRLNGNSVSGSSPVGGGGAAPGSPVGPMLGGFLRGVEASPLVMTLLPSSISYAAAAAAVAKTDKQDNGSARTAIQESSSVLEPVVLPSSSEEDEIFSSFGHGNWMAESAAIGARNVASKTVWLPELMLAPVPDFLSHLAAASP